MGGKVLDGTVAQHCVGVVQEVVEVALIILVLLGEVLRDLFAVNREGESIWKVKYFFFS